MTEIDKKMYHTFADKTLSEGCVIFHDVLVEYSRFSRHWDGMYVVSGIDGENCWHTDNCYILGHEPQLHDVFRMADKKLWLIDIKWGQVTITFSNRTYTSFKFDASIPLMSQPEVVKQQLIDLFQ